MKEIRRFHLGVSPGWQKVFKFTGQFSVCFGAIGLIGLVTEPSLELLFAVLFFGFSGIMVIRLIDQNSGALILREDGLVLDSHFSMGFIPWEDLEKVTVFTFLGAKYLGLSTRNVPAYLESRKNLPDLKSKGNQMMAQGWMRGTFALLGFIPASKKAVDLFIALWGWAPLPNSMREDALMEWQEESYGAQIVIQRMWIPDMDEALQALKARVQTKRPPTRPQSEPVSPSPPASPTPEPVLQPQEKKPSPIPRQPEPEPKPQHDSQSREAEPPPLPSQPDPEPAQALKTTPQPVEAQDKTCPMCAETIKAQARVCRYCRYSFQEEKFLA